MAQRQQAKASANNECECSDSGDYSGNYRLKSSGNRGIYFEKQKVPAVVVKKKKAFKLKVKSDIILSLRPK